MPFVKRQVEPIELSRARIPANITSKELDFITNHTLANVILQLSSLSKHAEDLFDELYLQSEKLITRTAAVQRRVERLQGKVTQLDATVEDVSLGNINNARAFRSSRHCQQQVVSRDTMPTALRQLYEACDPPPPLQKLTPYRPDGKDALKFYTDPSYFFELWRSQMLKETDSKHGQQQNQATDGSKNEGEKQRRAGRHKSPTAGAPTANTDITSTDKQQRDTNKAVRQPGTNRLDKYRQKAAGQDIINHVPGNMQQQQQQPQPAQFQQQPNFVAPQQQQVQYMSSAVKPPPQYESMQQQQQQAAACPIQYQTQQQIPQQMYQPAAAAQQPLPQTQKPYPAFVVSGMAAIPPVIGALDQPASQVWTTQQPLRNTTTTIPQLNYANNIPAGGGAVAAVFPGHTPTSASSMLVDENGRPAPHADFAAALSQQQGGQATAASEQYNVSTSYTTSAAPPPPQQHTRDVVYHTRTIPPVASTSGSSGAIPPSSLPLFTSNNSNSTPLSQQRAAAAGIAGGTSSPSRPMQPPPAPPTAAALIAAQQQQQPSSNNMAPSPPPPPSVGELTRASEADGAQLSQQFRQHLNMSGRFDNNATAAAAVPPPPPPPPPLLGSMRTVTTAGGSSGEADAPNLPAKAGAAAMAAAAAVKSPEFPPAPPVAMREVDRRSDLLAEIRKGIALRKSGFRGSAANSATESGNAPGVDSDNVSLSSSALQQNAAASKLGAKAGGAAATSTALSDVASILARRIAMRYSDTESDDGGGVTGHSFDTDEWDDKE